MTDKRFWLNIAVILCVSGVMMVAFLGTQPLWDPDEPVYAETAREMLQFHDFISPRIYGDFWYDKPPMYYWLVAGAFKVFGISEFSARFPSALLAVAGAVLLYVSGRKLFNDRAGLLAALVLATSLEYFYLGNAAVTDMTLTFFLTAALLSFIHGKYYLMYACAALAVVTKGPVGIFFCGAIILLYLVFTGGLRAVKHMKIISGAALFSAIALPWYLAMYHYHGMAFIDTFLGFHNMTRFLQPEHAAGQIWYYYIPVLILGFFPWTAFLGQAITQVFKDKGQDRNYSLFFFLWAAVVFVFFSVSQTKLVSYILPMYPPIALLVGHYIDKAWTEKRDKALKWSGILFAAVASLLVAALFYASSVVTSELLFSVKMLAGIFALLAVIVMLLSIRGGFHTVFAAQVIGMLIFATFLMTQTLPVVAASTSVRSFATVFKQHYDGKAPVYVAKFYRPGFAFYSELAGIELKAEDLQAAINNHEKAYFIMKTSYYEKIPQDVKDKMVVLAIVEDKILFVHNPY